MVANISDWDAFTTALLSRYKGRIKAYELWNEPDQNSEWTGSVADMVTLTNHFHDIVRNIDPSALIISPTVNGYQDGFMSAYWASGGTTDVDVIGLHGEPGSIHAETIGGALITGPNSLMSMYGLTHKPIWDTEAMPSVDLSADQLAAFVALDYLLHWSNGVKRLYWYEWDIEGPSALKNAPAAAAYQQVYKWMVGSKMGACSLNGSNDIYSAVYTCDLTTNNGQHTRAVWNSSGNTSTYTVPTGYTKYVDLTGTVHHIIGRTINIDNKPVLLEP